MLLLTRQDRESLRNYLLECLTPEAGRWGGEVCDNTLRYTTTWLSSEGFDGEAYTAAFQEAGSVCDCRVLIYTLRAYE